ncbi:MAG: thiamine-phosphate kinase, partial [Propionibacteriaceae bacterium]|nr:thiamine-phosphate kinase [Propionibacteriaceae bacterium]
TTTVDWVDRFISGVRAELESAQVSLVGGDLSSSSIISVAVTAIGQTRGQRVITRSGALPGQAVAHRGLIGQAAAGLAVLSRGFRSPRALVSAYQRPEIPYGAGAEARRHGATAMIDVSDGLVADLEHIAQASGVVIDIDSGTLPMSEPLSAVAHATGRDPLDFLLAGGEDHGLVATFPFGEVPPLWTVVGQVVERGDRDPMVCVDGKQWLGAKGWNHFAVK